MIFNDKIKSFDNLAHHLTAMRAEGKKVVLCHGVFDLLHIGHIRHLQEASRFGDVLVVTLTEDKFVNKGPNRPAFAQNLRAEAIAALDCVSYVAINRWPTSVQTIKLLRPSVYAKGPDYKDSSKDVTGKIREEMDAVLSVGGKICFTDDITFSSSNLLNRLMPSLDEKTNRYLEIFRDNFSPEQVTEHVDELKDLRIVVVGETIIDEYVYCDPLGKSGKESMLVMKYVARDRYAGGAAAIANHLGEFCDKVSLITYLGGKRRQEGFVQERLKDNVEPVIVHKSGSPTIVKRRFVDKYSFSKLLGVYEINDEPLSGEEDRLFGEMLESHLPECDLVVVADYGHGLISSKAIQILETQSPFLSINTQINAVNIGFHAISKYSRADHICIHEGEIRLDQRSKKGTLKNLILNLSRRMNCPSVMVTRGKNGSMLYHEGKGFYECPSFAMNVVDRVGAGDAVLALTSAMAYKKVPPEVINFAANMIGAEAVKIRGNERSIDRISLLKGITAVLK